MEIITLLLIALGLAMDAFAVSVSNGMCYHNITKKQAVMTSFTFGLFQAVMPVLGYLVGRSVSAAVSFLDHWIALIILGLIGARMIYGAVKEMRHPDKEKEPKCYTKRVMLMQGIATSIDAFAVGISFAVIGADIIAAAAFIGGITFIVCLIGAYIGNRFGSLLKDYAEIFGGAVLVLIGIKIFVEHMLSGK